MLASRSFFARSVTRFDVTGRRVARQPAPQDWQNRAIDNTQHSLINIASKRLYSLFAYAQIDDLAVRRRIEADELTFRFILHLLLQAGYAKPKRDTFYFTKISVKFATTTAVARWTLRQLCFESFSILFNRNGACSKEAFDNSAKGIYFVG